MENIISIKNLRKKYSSGFELGEINLEIPSGAIIGLIGENGAGKTTFIKTLLNIIEADSGEIIIFGKNHNDEEKIIKEDIGIVFDNMFFPEILTPRDIDFCMESIYKKWDSALFKKYLDDFSLLENEQIKTMSTGMKKKLYIATALSHHPKLLILDEPTSGLDPVIRSEVLDVFLDFIQDSQHTILLSTHITSDLEYIADYIIFMDKGKIILNTEKNEIDNNYGILKCDIDSFSKIDKKDIICYNKNKYNYHIMINNREKLKKKYKDYIIDKVNIEEMMLLMIKGEK